LSESDGSSGAMCDTAQQANHHRIRAQRPRQRLVMCQLSRLLNVRFSPLQSTALASSFVYLQAKYEVGIEL